MWAVLGITFLAHGCSDPNVTRFQKVVLLSEVPDGSVTIEDARSSIDSVTDVVLTARIGVRELPQWWVDGKSSFYVSEGTPGSHYAAGPDHDPATCPFCSRNWKVEDSMALIHLVDETGERIPVEATKLLNVDDGDLVVVRGTASLDESGHLIVESNGVFIQ